MHLYLISAKQGLLPRSPFAWMPRWFPAVAVSFTLICCSAAVAQQSSNNLIGASRDDVIQTFGEPENTLKKGNVDLLVYPDGVRIEIRDNVVIDYRGSVGSGIISRGGTEYSAGADGNVQRADQLETVPDNEESEIDDQQELETAESDVSAVESPAGEEAIDPDAVQEAAEIPTAESPVQEEVTPEPPPPPPWEKPAKTGIGWVVRFVFVFFILRLTVRLMGQPIRRSELIKISLLTAGLIAAISGIGGVGGGVQFIDVYRIPEIVGLFTLWITLYSSEVAKDGFTALKMAAVNAVITLLLMEGVTRGLTSAFLAMR